MTVSLIAAVTRLADILARENAALQTMDMEAATGLLAEKTSILADIAVFQKGQPADPPANRPGMDDLADKLRTQVMENRRLLEIALIAQGRVVSLIARAASVQHNRTIAGYGIGGCPTTSRPPALAISARA